MWGCVSHVGYVVCVCVPYGLWGVLCVCPVKCVYEFVCYVMCLSTLYPVQTYPRLKLTTTEWLVSEQLQTNSGLRVKLAVEHSLICERENDLWLQPSWG